MAEPLVSLLMPVRDMVSTVDAAYASVADELGPADELVLVDDGSIDGSTARLSTIAHSDPRVRVVSGPRRGLAQALNTGLARCLGRYIARMDADDVSLPGRIRRAVATLEEDPSLAALGTQVEIFRDDQPVSPNMQAYAAWLSSLTTPEAIFRDRFVESPLCHPSTTLRASALREVGGFPEGDFPEDYALWLELLGRGHRLTNLPSPLFRWRDHPTRATRADPRYAPRRHLELKALHLARLLRGACGILGAGKTGLALSRALGACGVSTRFFVDVSPKKVGTVQLGAKVHPHAFLAGPEGTHLLLAVGSKGGRAELRALLTSRGYVEGRDFTAVA